MQLTNKINEFLNLIKNAKKIVILTGAGISTESGLPDFRSDDGFWTKNKPIFFKEFLQDEESRKLSWKRNFELKEKLKSIKPNSGHVFVRDLINTSLEHYLITQNIDGLHSVAGLDNKKIIEIHGNATKASCLNCYKEFDPSIFHDSVLNDIDIPDCDECGSLVKVSTISFGQSMNEKDHTDAMYLTQASDLFIAIGTSLSVQPVAKLPELAKKNGSKLIILNREATPLDNLADLVLNGELKDIFSKISENLSIVH
jgi:NAD-dependent deacetylase